MMRFNSRGKNLIATPEPKVGDVFPSKSTGPKSYRNGTRYWLLIAITPSPRGPALNPIHVVHHFLGLDREGNVVSTSTYGDHVMKERPLVGRCKDLSALNLEIEWEYGERTTQPERKGGES